MPVSANATQASLTATLLFALGVLLSCSAAPARAQEMAPEAPAGEPILLEGTLSEYFIYLPQVITTPGTVVRFAVENTGVQRHNLRVVGNGVDRVTPVLRGGQSGAVDVSFPEPGAFTVYCDIGDHADLGMTTGFYVEEPFTGS